jgi:hypothetical protein
MAKVKATGESRNFFCAPQEPGSQAAPHQKNTLQSVRMAVKDAKPPTEAARRALLDTMEIRPDKSAEELVTKFADAPQKGLWKQRKRKLNSQGNTRRLAQYNELIGDDKSSRKYWNQYHCRDIKIVWNGYLNGGQMNDYGQMTCKARSCPMCAAKRAYLLFRQYRAALKELQELGGLVFITLTAPTVTGDKLKDEIRARRKVLSRMIASQKKRYHRDKAAWYYRGLIRQEVTIRPEDLYHPHLHLLIQGGEEEARQIIKEWLDQANKAGIYAQIAGQDYRIVSSAEDGLEEMIKYTVKDGYKDDKDKNKLSHWPAERQDVVWKAMAGVRAIHPVEIKAAIEEPEEGQEPQELEEAEGAVKVPLTVGNGYWKWSGRDWASMEQEELFRDHILPDLKRIKEGAAKPKRE